MAQCLRTVGWGMYRWEADRKRSMTDRPEMTDASPESLEQINQQQPWLGLASFTEETRGFFYGREEEVGELARRVQRKLLTVLFGQSGLGKTSILRAGIVPRLRPEGYCPVYVRIDYAPDSPSPTEQIKQAIFTATASTGHWTKAGTAIEGESLWEFLHHRDDILKDANGKTLIPLLIFDQFEEIFTIAQTDDVSRNRAASFIEDLADLVENRLPKKVEALLEEDDSITERFDFNREDYRVLIALREDYLAHLESVKGVMPSITQNRMRLAPMTGSQALAAVIKPGGKLVSQEVAESIVRFVAGGSELANAEVEPSLLSLICRELNNTRIAKGKSEISVDLLAGSHDTILAEFYERALADQPAAVRKVIEDQLLTDSGYRENLAEERVLKAFTEAGARPDAATTLATLVNRRLLRTEDRLDRRRVELTHDVLCGVVKASRAQRLERETREEAAKTLAAQQERQRVTRKALIHARRIAAGCAALSVVAVASGVYGIYSANRAEKAEAEAVKTHAISETSREESEKLVVYILDDFYEEMSPIGRLDVVGGLAKKAVEYYDKLPPEARTQDTKRNSAIAQARYAHVTTLLGRADESTALVERAKKTLNDMRSSGDTSDETLIALARVAVAEVSNISNRGDLAGATTAAEAGLKVLGPVLARPDAPKSATLTEGILRSNVGFALLRRGLPEAAIEQYLAARKIAAASGALDLSNLVATSGYATAGWVLGEALATSGKPEQATPILLETIALVDRLLEKRPGHRPALRAKATAINQLGRMEADNLRFTSSMRYARDAQRVQEQVTALDPGNSGSQNNLRVAKAFVQQAQYQLGRVEEANTTLQALVTIDKAEKINGFSQRNLLSWHGILAEAAAQEGKFDTAAAELRKADQYLASLLALSNDPRTRTGVPEELAGRRARIDLLAGVKQKIDAIEPEMAKYVTAMLALRTAMGKDAAAGSNRILPGLYETAYRALMTKNDYAGAAGYAQQEVQERLRDERPSLEQQRGIHVARTRLAIALARQAKVYDASNTLKPVLAFYQLPAVQKSDAVTLKGDYAEALFAAALSTPAEKQALLARALQSFDAMPAQMKAQKSNVRIREDIVLEQGRKP